MTTSQLAGSQPIGGQSIPAERAARRQLTLYFSLLVVGSAVLEWLIIRTGEPIQQHIGLAHTLMWVPAMASAICRITFREGIADVSFRIGGAEGWRAIGIAVLFPIVVGIAAYGLAWSAGLVGFDPPTPKRLLGEQLIQMIASLGPVGRFGTYLLLAATLGTVVGITSAAGEEIGWRGYMLARLVRAGVPHPLVTSGAIWAFWHVPLIVSGVYAAGPHPVMSAALFVVLVIGMGVAIGVLRLRTGSVWPAVIMHAAWNAIIQGPFDRSSVGPGATVWVGESGILVAFFGVLAAAALYRWWWSPEKLDVGR